MILLILALGLVQDKPADPFQVRFVHEGACEAYDKDQICRKDGHWKIDAGDRRVKFIEDLQELLQKEGDTLRIGTPGAGRSERNVVIGGQRSTPWGLILDVMSQCARVGIYKVDWDLPAKDKDEATLLKMWYPEPEPPRNPDLWRVGDIHVLMRWDPALGQTVRRIAHRPPAVSDEALVKDMHETKKDWAKAGLAKTTVLLEPGADVAWSDVIHVVKLCRKESLGPIDWRDPLRRRPLEKK